MSPASVPPSLDVKQVCLELLAEMQKSRPEPITQTQNEDAILQTLKLGARDSTSIAVRTISVTHLFSLLELFAK